MIWDLIDALNRMDKHEAAVKDGEIYLREAPMKPPTDVELFAARVTLGTFNDLPETDPQLAAHLQAQIDAHMESIMRPAGEYFDHPDCRIPVGTDLEPAE